MTKLRRAEDDRDRRRRDLIPAMADWLWEADAEGCVSFLSPEFAASTGLSPQSLLGKRLAQLDAADLAGTRAEEQRTAVAAGKPFRELVFKLDAADGQRVWVEIAGTPAAEDGGFEGYWGTGKTV